MADDDVICCVTLSLFTIAPFAFVVFTLDLCMEIYVCVCVVYLRVQGCACMGAFECANVRCVSKRFVSGNYR